MRKKQRFENRKKNRGRDEKPKVGDEKKWRLEVRNDGEKIEIGDWRWIE